MTVSLRCGCAFFLEKLAIIKCRLSLPESVARHLSRDDEQDGLSGSIKNQQSILDKYAKDNGFRNPRFFVDDGFSGVTFTRPSFMEMMDLAEQGKIGTIIVKDHSRLGRNRLVVGQLLEEDFERLDVRYIAVMDNIDTAKGISDLVPMQDLFNEWHAKNTSQKVRNVLRNKGLSGAPLTTIPPFGYKKNPDNPKEWLVDEPAAEVVKRIFDMCVAGFGPTQIAKKLKVDKVMTPTEYWRSIGMVLVYKCGQEKLNNLYYQVKEQRRCSTWRRTKNLTLRNLNSRLWICIMPEEPRIQNWNVNMA